jgi:hypothetical protein
MRPICPLALTGEYVAVEKLEASYKKATPVVDQVRFISVQRLEKTTCFQIYWQEGCLL